MVANNGKVLPIGPYRNMMGATDCGVSSTTFPGARPVTPAAAAEMSALWGANIPSSVGLEHSRYFGGRPTGKHRLLVSDGWKFTVRITQTQNDEHHTQQRLHARASRDIV